MGKGLWGTQGHLVVVSGQNRYDLRLVVGNGLSEEVSSTLLGTAAGDNFLGRCKLQFAPRRFFVVLRQRISSPVLGFQNELLALLVL